MRCALQAKDAGEASVACTNLPLCAMQTCSFFQNHQAGASGRAMLPQLLLHRQQKLHNSNSMLQQRHPPSCSSTTPWLVPSNHSTPGKGRETESACMSVA